MAASCVCAFTRSIGTGAGSELPRELIVPPLGFPYSRTLFLAFDLWVRPATPEDFVLPHEPGHPPD